MPSFWSDARLEPKRQYRFRLLLSSDPAYIVTKVSNPTVKISETPHKFLNHTFYYPGRAEWDPIDISFVDPSGPDDQSNRLFSKLLASGYRNPTTNAQALSGFTKNAATTLGVGKVVIQQLGPESGPLDTTLGAIAQWEVFNAFFTNITWGSYDYNGEDMLELSTTIRYDYAQYSVIGGNAGTK
jgi:hypothetical protein